MKPKVKVYSYESWSSPGYNNVSMLKDDTPMDLSVKRHSPEHSINSFHIHSESDREHISRNLLYNELNCGYPLYTSKHESNSPNLLPYLLLHSKSCEDLHQNTSFYDANLKEHIDSYSPVAVSRDRFADVDRKSAKNFYRQKWRNETWRSGFCDDSSLLRSHDYLESSKFRACLPSNPAVTGNGSQRFCNGHWSSGLIKACSESYLERIYSREPMMFALHRRWKSEGDLTRVHLSDSFKTERVEAERPLSLIQKRINAINVPSPIFPKRLSYEEDMASEDLESEDALDLRVCNSSTRLHHMQHEASLESEYLFQHIRALLSNTSSHHKDVFGSFASLNPWEAYKQYYYYLMNQPSFASRAAVAAAMADTYGKLISSNTSATTQPPTSELRELPAHKYNAIESSLDGKTELRSADTTNGLDLNSERKRISRPLTGRHVRHGTGASPSTLLSLRRMIQERQRLKELGINCAQTKQKTRKGQKKK